MTAGKLLRRRFGTTALVATVSSAWLAHPTPVRAYNEPAHQDMTRVAVDIMRMVAWQADPTHLNIAPNLAASLWEAPTGIDQGEWQSFMESTADGAFRLLAADNGLPNLGSCSVAGLPLHKTNAEEDKGFHWEYIQKERDGYLQCSQEEYKGSLATLLDTHFPHGVDAGSALGVHAVAPDHYENDWHLYYNPLMVGPVAHTMNLLDVATTAGLGAALAPILCPIRWLIGKPCSINDIRNFADRANVLPEIIGLIPAPTVLFDFKHSATTGMAHLMNYGPTAQNYYDDIEGYHMERSGWRGRPGIVDLSIMLAADLTGITIDPKESDGVRDYEVVESEVFDSHPKSKRRSNGHWRAATLGHTTFTPLDNLAYLGWRRSLNPDFPDDGAIGNVKIAHLARPLHALGDIAAPHHLIAGLGWGHRPYENMVSWYWRYIIKIDGSGSSSEQYEGWRDVLVRAFRWHKFIRDWRANFNPTYDKDIPIREMITRMGYRNYSYITKGSEENFANTTGRIGFNDLPADAFCYVDVVHERNNGDGLFTKIWAENNGTEIEYLIRNGTAGILAFLVAAAESMPATSCGDGMVQTGEACDDGSTAGGDGCASCIVEEGWECNDDWPSVCSAAECGDNIRAGAEECDHGLSGSTTCTATCEIIPSDCGDGIVQPAEACDDGNVNNNDGCQSCVIQNGWVCSGSPSVCGAAQCGDYIRAGSEYCDDGPTGSPSCNTNCEYIIW